MKNNTNPDSLQRRDERDISRCGDPQMLWSTVGDWFVVHTMSRQEKALAKDLGMMGVNFFLPLATHRRMHGKRRVSVETPLFPGYMFVKGDYCDLMELDRTKRVVRLIKAQDQKQIAWELKNLSIALSCDVPLDPFPYLEVGLHVEVLSGPFKGLEGIIESRAKDQRVILQVDMLGRALSVEVDGAVLKVIGETSAVC